MKKKFSEKQIHILDVAEKLIAKKDFIVNGCAYIKGDEVNIKDISRIIENKKKYILMV